MSAPPELEGGQQLGDQQPTGGDGAPVGQADSASAAQIGANVAAQVPEFAELADSSTKGQPAPLDHVLDVSVTVTAELGRVALPIGELLKLGVGSVVELNRPISEPVELLAQGVRLARGEVVVVDDRFAVRIKEIAEPKGKRSTGGAAAAG